MQTDEHNSSTPAPSLVDLSNSYLTLDQRERIYFSGFLSEASKAALQDSLSKAGRLKTHLFLDKVSKRLQGKPDKSDKRLSYWVYIVGLMIIRALWKQSFGAAAILIVGLAAYIFFVKRDTESDGAKEEKSSQPPKPHEIQEIKNHIGKSGYTQLMFAAQAWDLKSMSEAISNDPSKVNVADDKGYAPLMYALNADFIDGIKSLLDNGAEFDFNEAEDRKSFIKFIKSEMACFLLLIELDRRKKAQPTA